MINDSRIPCIVTETHVGVNPNLQLGLLWRLSKFPRSLSKQTKAVAKNLQSSPSMHESNVSVYASLLSDKLKLENMTHLQPSGSESK